MNQIIKEKEYIFNMRYHHLNDPQVSWNSFGQVLYDMLSMSRNTFLVL